MCVQVTDEVDDVSSAEFRKLEEKLNEGKWGMSHTTPTTTSKWWKGNRQTHAQKQCKMYSNKRYKCDDRKDVTFCPGFWL